MKNLIIVLISVGFVFSCAPTTMVTGSWVDPQKPQKDYDHIMVAALTTNVNAKTTLESDLAAQLREEGLMVSRSGDVFPPNFTNDQNKKELLDEIDNEGADAILTVSLLDKEADVRYVPGPDPYQPYPVMGYYGNFYGYYSHMYPLVYSPGYYTMDRTYFMEANLYDADTEALIWSAQSKTYDPEYMDNFSESFSEAITEKMDEENVVI